MLTAAAHAADAMAAVRRRIQSLNTGPFSATPIAVGERLFTRWAFRDVLENNLPVRFWKNLPEGPLIPQLMQRARSGEQRHGQALAVGLRAGKVIRPRADDAATSGNAGPDRPRSPAG